MASGEASRLHPGCSRQLCPPAASDSRAGKLWLLDWLSDHAPYVLALSSLPCGSSEPHNVPSRWKTERASVSLRLPGKDWGWGLKQR